jgi:putative ABC transport system permease protein
VAEKLFVSAEIALGKLVQVRGKKVQVIGVVKKQGKSMIGGWQFDQSVIMPRASRDSSRRSLR